MSSKIQMSFFICLCLSLNICSGATLIPKPIASEEELIIPFQLIKNLIVVEAYVDGKKGNFIVDTGSKHLLLNAEYFTGFVKHSLQVQNFNGTSSPLRERKVNFNWIEKEGRKHTALISSFKQLDKIFEIPIFGYIGYDILKNHEIQLDYRNSIITLFELDKRGNRKAEPNNEHQANKKIQLRDNEYMPYLLVNIGSRKLRLGIDTGSALNLLSKRIVKKLDAYFQPGYSIPTAGFNGEISLSESGLLRELQLGQFCWSPMKCVVTQMDHLNFILRVGLDGLLGYEFLKQFKLSINYKKNELYIWPPSAYAKID